MIIAQIDTGLLDPTDQAGPFLHLPVTGPAINDSLFVILPACQFALVQNDDGESASVCCQSQSRAQPRGACADNQNIDIFIVPFAVRD